MAYISLNKLFYSDSEHYLALYHQRYQSPYAQHIDFMLGEAPAFFVVTPEVQEQILAIHKMDKKIMLLCEKQLPGVALDQFSRRCLIDEIVLTNHIEGVHSTRREIDGVLADLEKRDKCTRFKGLVQKYLMLQRGEDIPLKTCENVRQIYDDLVLQEVAQDHPECVPDGTIFRKESVSVYSPTQKEIHRGLYPEARIIGAMEQALAYLNDGAVELLYRIPVFHYLLGYIHPFYDGNGRLNRFISSYMLTKELQPILSYRLSYTVEEHISKYYEAFRICNHPNNRGDLTPFVGMFLGIIRESAEQLFEALEKRRVQLRYYEEIIRRLPQAEDPVPGKLCFYLVQAELFSEHGISTRELLDILGVSRATLRKRLAEIDRAGLLKTVKYKNEKCYGIDLAAMERAAGSGQ